VDQAGGGVGGRGWREGMGAIGRRGLYSLSIWRRGLYPNVSSPRTADRRMPQGSPEE
jgi:hypothetical protein